MTQDDKATVAWSLVLILAAWIGAYIITPSGTASTAALYNYSAGPGEVAGQPLELMQAQDPGIVWLGATPAIPGSIQALLRHTNQVSVFGLDPGPETFAAGIRQAGDALTDSPTGAFQAAMAPSRSGDVRVQVAVGPGQKVVAVLNCSLSTCAPQSTTLLHGRACAWTLGAACVAVSLNSDAITVVLMATGASGGLTTDDLYAMLSWAQGPSARSGPIPVYSS